MSTASDYFGLARHLASSFTACIIERRGRGQSAPQPSSYSLQTEVGDLNAAIESSNATAVFGHSYGGLIALQTAVQNPRIERLALYEPGVPVGRSIPTDWMASARRSLEAGDALAGFAKFSVAAGPASARRMPVWLMKLALRASLPREGLRTMLEIFPTTLAEHEAISTAGRVIDEGTRLHARCLVIYGGKSGLDWVPATVDHLQRAAPASVHRFETLDHFGPTGPRSREIAALLAEFFSRS